jgi:hypothetical protein
MWIVRHGVRIMGWLLTTTPLHQSNLADDMVNSASISGAGTDRLTERMVVPFLVERGLLDTLAIVDGDLEVVNMSRRNVNFRVTTTHEPSYFVKQAVGTDRIGTIGREAAFLMAAACAAGYSGMRSYLPSVVAWDQERHILVFNLEPDTYSLAEHHLRTRRHTSGLARQVAIALRQLHRWRPDADESIHDACTNHEPPPILSIHRPDLRVFEHMSGSGLENNKNLQETPNITPRFDAMRRAWRPWSILHGDMKWDNVVLLPKPDGKSGFQVQLVDWEMVQLGDPLWDAASFLAQYLDAWIASIPVAGNSPRAAAASTPLSRIQPAMRQFWEVYTRGIPATTTDRTLALERIVGYASARLVQFAIEADQQSAVLSASGVVRLQVAHNMMQRPLEAASSLLGLAV